MKLARAFFTPNVSEKNWFRIVLWWELRRIPYNVFLILFLFISLYFLSFIPNDGFIKILPGPGLIVGFYVTLLFYFISANALFTTGWIYQLLIRNYNIKLLEKINRNAFIYGLILSFIITISPVFVGLLNWCLG